MPAPPLHGRARTPRDLGSVPGLENPLEKEMATHSSILAWKIPWTKEAGRLQSMESQSPHDLATFYFPS